MPFFFIKFNLQQFQLQCATIFNPKRMGKLKWIYYKISKCWFLFLSFSYVGLKCSITQQYIDEPEMFHLRAAQQYVFQVFLPLGQASKHLHLPKLNMCHSQPHLNTIPQAKFFQDYVQESLGQCGQGQHHSIGTVWQRLLHSESCHRSLWNQVCGAPLWQACQRMRTVDYGLQ